MAVRNRSIEGSALSRVAAALPLAAVLLAALLFRLYGIDWDDGHLFHPDERHILMVSQRLQWPEPFTLDGLLGVDSPLNPKSFAYGSLAFYLLRGTSALAGWLGASIGVEWLANLSSFDGMRLVGRALSTAFDLGTVLFVYLTARKLFGHVAGLLGAAFVAFATLHVQLSHFYASDPILTFFVTLVLHALVGVYRDEGRRWPVIAGLAVGCALATKVSAAPILGVVGLVYLGRALTRESDGGDGERPSLVARERWLPELNRALADGLVTVGVAIFTFAACAPFAIIDFATFTKHVAEQNAMARGVADFPYTRQFANRPLYLYFVENLAIFGLGVPLALAAFAGTAFAVVRSIRRPVFGYLLLLAWIVPYFAITGGFHAKFVRYMLPIVPSLCILAAAGIVALAGWRTASGLPRRLAIVVAAIVVGLSALYATAYVRIYASEHTAIAASRFIYEQVPPKSVIATEHWDEGMPLTIREGGRQIDPGQLGYRTITLNIYDDDNEAKLNHIVQQLDQADYVVMFSNRLYGTIPRLPARYPMTSEYYRLLFGERLGYELVGAFSSYPNLLGVHLADDTLSEPKLPTPKLLAERSPLAINVGHADESFSVYDHPMVLVFKRTQRLPASEIRGLLQPHLTRPGASRPVVVASYKSLLQAPARSAANQIGGTFSDLFDRTSLPNRLPVVAWVLMVEALGLAAAPLLFPLARGLADRGYFLAKTLGVLLLGWVSWFVASAGLAPATRGLTIAVFLALLIAGSVAAFLQRREVRDHLRARWRLLAAAEVVFWVGFALFLAIRLANPDLWHPARGGEKPMDLAYLTAVIKSESYPPYDPWFAGGYLNYYYFGQLLVGTLIKLTGIVPTTAYNLVVPTLFALTFVGAFGVAYNLVGERWGRARPTVAGVGAAVVVCALGNLGGGQQLKDQLIGIGKLSYEPTVPFLGDVARTLAGVLRVASGARLEVPTDWYWASTRVVPGTINEFPYFTFLYADLHAHMIALPLTLLALGLAVNVALARPAGPAETGGEGQPLRRLLPVVGLALLALAVGALYPTNSWDYPTYLGIAVISLAVPVFLAGRTTRRDVLALGLKAATVVALSYLLYLPFHSGFQSFYSGVKPHSDHSSINAYLMIHGLLLAAGLTFVVADFAWRFGRNGTLRGIGQFLRWWDHAFRLVSLRRWLVAREDVAGSAFGLAAIVVALAALALAAAGMELVGMLGLLLALVGFLALQRRREPAELLLLAMLGTGLALGIVTEFVAIDGDIGRMNTVFKFYLQVWVLWGIVGVVGVARAWDWLTGERGAAPKRIWLAVLAFLVLSSAIYPTLATAARVRDRFDATIAATLDGAAYMVRAVYHDEGRPIRLASDAEALRWLQENVAGSPVILEGNAPLYRWGSRVSVYTGLPTVIGWDWHQKQQRWGYQSQVDDRLRDVKALYTDASVPRTLDLLDRYDVRYIYVGDLERLYYPGAGLAKFDRMVGQQLDLVYDRDGVRIYRVREGS